MQDLFNIPLEWQSWKVSFDLTLDARAVVHGIQCIDLQYMKVLAKKFSIPKNQFRAVDDLLLLTLVYPNMICNERKACQSISNADFFT